MIYLDHAATTPPDGRVIEAMAQCMCESWQNPSAAYAAAGIARRALRQARQAMAALLNADASQVLFTSGGTEANNQAMLPARGGHVVISAIEHASVLNAARAICGEVTLVPPDGAGQISPEAVSRVLRPETRLISVQLANNETGVLQSVAAIGALARERRIPYHCDAVQAFGHVPLAVLVNGRSASASEILASAVQALGRGTVVGLTTYGKGIVQSLINFKEDGAGMQLTTSSYYDARDRSPQGVGVAPDVEVALEGNAIPLEPDPTSDNQLAAAIADINRQIAGLTPR